MIHSLLVLVMVNVSCLISPVVMVKTTLSLPLFGFVCYLHLLLKKLTLDRPVAALRTEQSEFLNKAKESLSRRNVDIDAVLAARKAGPKPVIEPEPAPYVEPVRETLHYPMDFPGPITPADPEFPRTFPSPTIVRHEPPKVEVVVESIPLELDPNAPLLVDLKALECHLYPYLQKITFGRVYGPEDGKAQPWGYWLRYLSDSLSMFDTATLMMRYEESVKLLAGLSSEIGSGVLLFWLVNGLLVLGWCLRRIGFQLFPEPLVPLRPCLVLGLFVFGLALPRLFSLCLSPTAVLMLAVWFLALLALVSDWCLLTRFYRLIGREAPSQLFLLVFVFVQAFLFPYFESLWRVASILADDFPTVED